MTDNISRICIRCKKEKESTLKYFNRNFRRKDGLTTLCKECRNISNKEWYKNNKEKINYNARIRYSSKKKYREMGARASKKHYQKQLHVIIQEYKTKCIICDEDDHLSLDFHHLRDKKSNVGSMIGNASLEKIIKEIEKCIVICSNCHRTRRNTCVLYVRNKKP